MVLCSSLGEYYGFYSVYHTHDVTTGNTGAQETKLHEKNGTYGITEHMEDSPQENDG